MEKKLTRAEERAIDAWAIYEYREHPKGLYHTCFVDGYKEGYEQAEKDLARPEPSKDLKEAAGLYLDSHKPLTRYNWGDLQDAFIAGAEWMRKKDVEDMYMSDNRHFLKCYEQGKVDMKVEMMKDAVEAEITVGRLSDDWSLAYNPDELHRALLKFKSGGKVKIIIVKQ